MTLLFAVRILAAALAAVTPVFAAEKPATPGFKMGTDEMFTSETQVAQKMPDVAVKASYMHVRFEVTTLEQIQGTFGGDIAAFEGDKRGLRWLCYVVPSAGTNHPASLAWFASDGVVGTGTMVNIIILETLPTPVPAGCAAPTMPLVLTLNLPTLGATAETVRDALGVSPDIGVMTYTGVKRPTAKTPPTDEPVQVTLKYLIGDHTKVDAISLLQITPH